MEIYIHTKVFLKYLKNADENLDPLVLNGVFHKATGNVDLNRFSQKKSQEWTEQ